MLKQIYNIGGLDLRSSDINRPENKASDIQNVELNSRRELVKRFGYDKLVDDTSILDIYSYKEKTLLIGMKARTIATFNTSTNVFDLAKQAMFDPPIYTGKFSFAEYNNTLYIADQEGVNDIMKFDGSRFYRAGLPSPTASHTGGAGTTDVRIVLFTRDFNGNVTISDYVEFNNVADGTTFLVDSFKDTNFNFTYGTANGTQIITTTNLTLATNTHNFVAGDKLLRWVGGSNFPSDGAWLELDIESVVANTSVTFTLASVTAAAGYTLNFSDTLPIDEQHWGIFFSKPSTGFQYYKAGSFLIDNTVASSTWTSSTYSALETPMEDISDPSIVKELPPRGKYLAIFNSLMVIGNISLVEGDPFYDVAASDLNSTVRWSDSVGRPGSSVETFLPFNSEVIGKSEEGEVSGLFSNSDYVEIHTPKQIYYLTGDLIQSNYKVKSALSAGVGAVSHRSIAEIVGQSIFLTSKGLYGGVYGSPPLEMSDEIEPLFTEDTTGLSLEDAVTVVDIRKEKVLTFIPATLDADSIVVVYDLYHREWFKHKGINAKNGIALVNDLLYHHDGTSLYQRSTDYNDNTSAIDAFYSTAWHNLGFPSMDKKFINAVIISLTNTAWDLYLKSQSDWETTDETDETLSFTYKSAKDHELDTTYGNSMRLILGNDVVDEPLHITGYEYEYELTQEKPKGEE